MLEAQSRTDGLAKPYRRCNSVAFIDFFNISVTSLLLDNFESSILSKSLITMLYLVGLGLSDEKDITVRGLEVVKQCTRVYLEAYTSILLVDKEKLVSTAS